jgi:putative RNA 2'-phosphotransferase
MTSTDIKKRSIRLSWLLRHGARGTGMTMDSAGFAAITDVLRHTRLTRDELDIIVAENNKSRFEIRDVRIRAVQGHSMDGTPVTLEGLEASWEMVTTNDSLFHGTSVEAAKAILTSTGVHAAARSHVHLAPAVDATVGKRAAVDVLLVIDPEKLRAAGERIFRAPNGVLLTRLVPRDAVVGIRAATRMGDTRLAALRDLLVHQP